VSAVAPEAPPQSTCPRCGAHLAAGQDWCLECGTAATTRIARPPSWRVPAAIVLGVLALAGAGVAVAYAILSGDDPGASPAPATTTAPSGSTSAVTSWPPGRRAYTVVLLSAGDRASAAARAAALARAGARVGLLHSNRFAGLRPGFWIVFSGQYADLGAARRAAAALQQAAPGAYVQLIGRRR
jgi:sporulation related protein